MIGVEAAKGTVFGIPQDTFVILPLKTYAVNYGALIRQRSLYFIATSITDELFNDAVEESRFLMRVRRKLGPSEKDNFGIVTPDAITGLRDRLFGTIFIVAIAVPGIALIVGAIVIMNIMLVSVTERTKEIGIRKSLGARQIDILKQFLVEAVTLATHRRRSGNFSGVDRRRGSDGLDLSDLPVDLWRFLGALGSFGRSRRGLGTFSGVEGGAAGSDRGFES